MRVWIVCVKGTVYTVYDSFAKAEAAAAAMNIGDNATIIYKEVL